MATSGFKLRAISVFLMAVVRPDTYDVRDINSPRSKRSERESTHIIQEVSLLSLKVKFDGSAQIRASIGHNLTILKPRKNRQFRRNGIPELWMCILNSGSLTNIWQSLVEFQCVTICT